jgi:phosphatidylglycerophosphate synthase
VTLARIRDVARKRPEHEFVLNRLYGAHLSPFFTWVCVRAGLSPDQVTLLGGSMGLAGAALLLLPLGWWSLVAVVLFQIGYVLDFSDGQVARLTGRTSNSGAYLDWLTHFYVPIAAALAVGVSAAWASGTYAIAVLAGLAALELGSYPFSAKEHLLIAMQRHDARLAADPAFRGALWDDARAADTVASSSASVAPGVPGRRHGTSLRSLVGEMLIYPGAIHLLTVAIAIDLAAGLGDGALSGRSVLLAVWSLALVVHAPMAIRRNHQLIRAIEGQATPDRDGTS